MSIVILALVSMGGLSALFAVLLSVAHGRLRVEEDPRVGAVLEALPGINCGACGFASCHALAEAAVKGDVPPNSCVVGGNSVATQVAAVLGIEAEAREPTYAYVRCGAGASQRQKKAAYSGIPTCRAANLVMGGETACSYGCLGFGDCADVCPFGAISMVEGLPVVDLSKCTGCGQCVKVCPRSLIVLCSFSETAYRVKCSSHDAGRRARQICEKSCIACMRCAKSCPYEACSVEDSLAVIDPLNCQLCGICHLVCPTGAIVELQRGPAL